MVIINKKRMQIITICILVSIFSFIFKITDDNDNIKNNTLQTTATPISGKTIIVDAGHGSPDEGAESSKRYNRGTD